MNFEKLIVRIEQFVSINCLI